MQMIFCRVNFALDYLNELTINPIIHQQTWWSDEATFFTNGMINRHNDILWSDQNPNRTIERAQKSKGLSVWAAISSYGVIGPYFFHSEPGTDRAGRQIYGPIFNPCNVNGQNYLTMLREFAVPRMQRYQDFPDFYFVQDGAPPHFTNTVKNYLNAVFGPNWIGRGTTQVGSFAWPPRSPDLTPCDFWLWAI